MIAQNSHRDILFDIFNKKCASNHINATTEDFTTIFKELYLEWSEHGYDAHISFLALFEGEVGKKLRELKETKPELSR